MPSFSDLRRRWWLLLLLTVVLVGLFGRRVATLLTDVLWFRSVGFGEVYTTVLLVRVGLGLAAGLAAALLVGGNLLLTRSLAPGFRMPGPQEEGVERYRDLVDPHARPVALAVAAVVGLLSGLSVVGAWPTVLLGLNAAPFGRTDPQFGLDLGFFVFRLPLLVTVNAWLFTTLALTLLLALAGHYVFGGFRPQAAAQRISPRANAHLSLLLAALVGVRAWGFWLDQYQLSYSTRGVVTGLSYTDATAQLPAYRLLTLIAVVCVVLFLVNVRVRNLLLPASGLGILLVAAILLSGIYPAVIQRLRVEPQELARERPYIERNLELTRFGYDIALEQDAGDEAPVSFEEFPAAREIEPAALEEERGTLDAIRLWDPDVLSSVYAQLQGLRRYFGFADVDVDRYVVDGQQTQVNVAVRGLEPERLPDSSWQNRTLVYTHGFGVVASDVSRKTASGEPEFLLRDIPPRGIEEFELSQPRIYFGEQGPAYSVVGTEQRELDYVSNEEDAATFTYDGTDGVGIGSLPRRLAFAFRLAEPNLVLSSLLTDDSRILINREVEDRVEAVAPYLQLDGDPYPAIVDGRVLWILDGYTTTDMLPYSRRVDLGDLTATRETVLEPVPQQDGSLRLIEETRLLPGIEGSANYIRNSVKAVVDAYDGTITLYVADPDDPVLQAWRRVFPGSFTDLAEAPEELRAHFRYPEDLLRVQAELFTRYHIPDADGFYSNEDAWTIPIDSAELNNAPTPPPEGQEPPLRPYFLQLTLPGEDEGEFALVQPFNPLGRPNLSAWMAARSDPEHYGELRTYLMPPTETVDGTEQIQAQINQDPEIAPQITLFNESGSRVIYGNLLIVPIGDALLYAQPLFLRAEQGQIPELRLVVLSLGGRIVAEPTLEEALVALLGEAAPVEDAAEGGAPGEAPARPGADTDPAIAELIAQALAAFEEAQAALEAGDLGAYQEATERAGELLRQAQEATGEAPPAPEAADEPDAAGS